MVYSIALGLDKRQRMSWQWAHMGEDAHSPWRNTIEKKQMYRGLGQSISSQYLTPVAIS